MSLQRIRDLNTQIAQRNQGTDLQALRVTLRDSKKAEEVREAKTKIDAMLDEMDGWVKERDLLQADVNREARLSALDPSGRREAPLTPGASDKRAAVLAYGRALKSRGVKVMRDNRSGSLMFENTALASLSGETREAIELMEERYWAAFRNHSIAVLQGDAGLCPAEDRAIMLGQVEEYSLLGSGSRNFELSAKEKRDMGIAVNSLGGYFVPRGFVYEIEEAMKWFGSMLESSEIMDTATGNTLPYPTDNDTTNTGELVGEGKQVSGADVSIGQILFGAEKFSTKMVKASLELLQDSAFDIPGYLKRKFAIRLGRILNTKFTNGVGSSANPLEPLGLLTAIIANCGTPTLASTSVAYGQPVLAAGSSPNTGGAETGGTSIGSQDLEDVTHTVDPSYRKESTYQLHDQTLRVIKRLLDKYGHPLWKGSMSVGDPDRLNGYAYWINNDYPTIAANATTVSFGAHKKYLIRRVKELGVVTLQERFADYGQVAYIGFARYDGNLLDAGTRPVCYLQQASA